MLAARRAIADLVGGDPRGVVFGRSATALTYDLARTLSAGWGPGDEVVVTRLDHDANIRPWVQAAERVGATVRWVDFDPATAELGVADVAAVVTDRTRLVAVTGASNLIGTRPPLPAIAGVVHAAGALLHVDGVHLTAHVAGRPGRAGLRHLRLLALQVPRPALRCAGGRPGVPGDPAPGQAAALHRRRARALRAGHAALRAAGRDDGGGGLPGLAGRVAGGRRERLLAAFERSRSTRTRCGPGWRRQLRALPGVTLWSRAAQRTPTLLVTFEGRDAADAYRYLAARRVNAPAGSFYALECSRHLGLGDAGGLRVGLAPYTDAARRRAAA